MEKFVRMLMELCPEASYEIVPFPEELKRIDIGDYFGSYSKIQYALGWEPRVTLQEGLSRTVEFFRANKQYYWQ